MSQSTRRADGHAAPGWLSESRARRLAEHVSGRAFPSLAALEDAAQALGFTADAAADALAALRERGQVVENVVGELVVVAEDARRAA